MSVAYLIGYPTRDPIRNPKRHPNRGRIARIESYRVVSAPKEQWSPSTTSSLSNAREPSNGVVA